MNNEQDDRPQTLAEQLEELNHHIRELRDEVLLEPLTTVLNAVGIETEPIDEVSEDVSLVEQAGAMLLGPVLAGLGTTLGFYAGIRLTQSPDIALGLGVVAGLIAGMVGLFAGPRYLLTNQGARR